MTRRKVTIFLFTVSLLVLAVFILLKLVLPVPKHTQNTGQFTIGTLTIELFDESRQRYLPSKVWFPIETNPTLKPAYWVSTYSQTGSALARLAGLPKFLFAQ